MLPALLQSLPIAIGILLSSLPLTMIPLMLRTRRDGRALGLFLAGWTLGFLLVGVAVLLLADSLSPAAEGPARWVNWVRVVLGLVLLWLAFKQWRGRPREGEAAVLPGWMSSIETMAPGRAAGLGLLLATLNPKYTVLIASGTLSIATATYQLGAQLGALLVFTAVASLGVFAPLLLSWLLGEKSVAPMERFKAWLVRYNAVILTVVLLVLGVVVLGVVVLGNGVSGFL